MSSNSSVVPLPIPPSLVSDPAFEARWANWLVHSREHDREGRRRLRMALVGLVAIVLPLALFFGTR